MLSKIQGRGASSAKDGVALCELNEQERGLIQRFRQLCSKDRQRLLRITEVVALSCIAETANQRDDQS